jgi:lipid II:glycine glycyltransferase (peptidoglycan interpeptide bridge formation enzyme)
MDIRQINFNWSDDYSIFASEKFLKSQSANFGWIGGFVEDKLKFVLPYVIKKRFIFKYLMFHSGTIYVEKDLSINTEKDFLNAAILYLKKIKIDFIAHPSSYVLFNTFPDKSIYAPFGSYIVDLTLSEEELWNNIHPKHKNVIRNAIKNNITIVKDKQNLDLAYELLTKTLDRSNMSFSNKDYFENILTNLNENIEIFFAYKNEEVQGCAIFPFSKYSSYYLWGGSSKNQLLGSLNLLQWEAMRYFKSLGVNYYNFVGARLKPDEGSKLEGIQRFKSRFGSNMKTGYLWKMPLNKFKFILFNILVKLRNIKSGNTKDIIDQEREKITSE